MRTEITNGTITFAAESRGAEPWVLKFNDDGVNYIWRPAPDVSGGTPICFPLLGAVPGGKYFLDGKEYAMGMHGFAQDCDFNIVEKTESSILYEISETPETLAQYPYRFRFQVLYALEDNVLKTEYRVKNCDQKEMFFSVGGHPRFACPIGGVEKWKFGDYALEFEKPEPIRNIIKSYGPLDVIAGFMSADSRTVKLDYHMFEKGCFCFNPGRDRVVTLKSPGSPRTIQMRIDGLAYFQVWTMVDGPFVALEPWYGSISALPAISSDGDWKARPGTLRIKPEEECRCVYYVTITANA
jgi:galactose mutarotase-like enzyme